MLKTALIVVFFLAGVVLLIFIWIRYQERYGLYHPTRFDVGWFEQLPPGYEAVDFETVDGETLWGVWQGGEAQTPVLILAHGNASDLRARLYWFDLVLPEGWNGFVFDYRGYGASSGYPSEEGLYRDIEAAIDYALQKSNDADIYLHGRSLGTALVARAAMYYPVKGLILDSGFPDAASAARSIFPLPGIGRLLKINFNTVEFLNKAQEKHGPLPKLFIHGTADRILPFRLGEKLYKAAPAPKEKWYVEEAGHNDLIYVAGEENYSRRLRKFLE
ncbi:MAG: alpha/beta hydrolase [bacterium]